MKKLYVDIETRCLLDLRKTSVYRYASDPSFNILMAGWSYEGEKVKMAIGHDEVCKIPYLTDSRVLKVAHNAPFERICFSNALFRGRKDWVFLPPASWRDTMSIGATRGWPKSLENMAKALGCEEKDSAGSRLVSLFTRPNRKGGWNGPDTHPMEWVDFLAYCEQDVYTLMDIDRVLEAQGDWPSKTEEEIFLADQRVNDTGIAIYVDLARKAVEASEVNQREQKARVTELSGVQNPNSVQQMGAWLHREGIKAPNLQAETVQKLLEGDLTDPQREVLELRQELALVASKKFSSALKGVNSDGRLRGTLAYFGAHTGRWSGRGTQVQNLPRLAFDNEVDQELCIQEVLNGERVSADDLKRLVRPMFTGPMTVVDFSAIEARVLAWLAGETWALDAFKAGRDIYVETAERMGGLTRSQGKVAVLALGYNGASNSLRAMAGDSDTFKVPGEDEPSFIKDLSDEQIVRYLVKPWRRANSKIVRFWQVMGDAFSEGGAVGKHLEVTTEEDRMGRAVYVWLPSGRPIGYHGTKWERYKVKDPLTGRLKSKEGWRYSDPKNPFNYNSRIGTYGGRLTENATQAVARDIQAEAIVRLHEAGKRVVGHVHDEVLVEGKNDVDEICSIMNVVPSWARGLPVGSEGFNTARYRKG